jgi:hypothetical protein
MRPVCGMPSANGSRVSPLRRAKEQCLGGSHDGYLLRREEEQFIAIDLSGNYSRALARHWSFPPTADIRLRRNIGRTILLLV